MNRNRLRSFFLILLLGTCAHNNGMMTPKTRQLINKTSRKASMPQTIIYTKTYTTPTLSDRFKNYYNQFQQWLRGPAKPETIIISEANVIVEKIKKGKSGYIDDFHFFLKNATQPEIDIFLNQLIKSPEGLYLLNSYVTFTSKEYIQQMLKQTGTPKSLNLILKKISTWAQNNIFQIILTIPTIDKNFFLLPLIVLSDQKLALTIKNNLVEIKKIHTGQILLQLLQQEDPDLYKTIVADADMISNIKNTITQEKNKLSTQE